MNASQYPAIDYYVPCEKGLSIAIPGNANYTFRCSNVCSRPIEGYGLTWAD